MDPARTWSQNMWPDDERAKRGMVGAACMSEQIALTHELQQTTLITFSTSELQITSAIEAGETSTSDLLGQLFGSAAASIDSD